MLKSFTTGTGAGEDIKFGEFTADVTLKAVFGASASLAGTIDNFEGDAVDPKWSVGLQKVTDADLTFALDDASPNSIAQGSGGETGRWSALAYGQREKRPEGITGAFNAYFVSARKITTHCICNHIWNLGNRRFLL